jgi:hypothetical protein
MAKPKQVSEGYQPTADKLEPGDQPAAQCNGSDFGKTPSSWFW